MSAGAAVRAVPPFFVALLFCCVFMRKIIILSDTHGCVDEKLRRHLKWADEIWHAGDIGSRETYDRLCRIAPVRAVYGNADGWDLRAELHASLRFECEGIRVLMTHIGGVSGTLRAVGTRAYRGGEAGSFRVRAFAYCQGSV